MRQREWSSQRHLTHLACIHSREMPTDTVTCIHVGHVPIWIWWCSRAAILGGAFLNSSLLGPVWYFYQSLLLSVSLLCTSFDQHHVTYKSIERCKLKLSVVLEWATEIFLFEVDSIMCYFFSRYVSAIQQQVNHWSVTQPFWCIVAVSSPSPPTCSCI